MKTTLQPIDYPSGIGLVIHLDAMSPQRWALIALEGDELILRTDWLPGGVPISGSRPAAVGLVDSGVVGFSSRDYDAQVWFVARGTATIQPTFLASGLPVDIKATSTHIAVSYGDESSAFAPDSTDARLVITDWTGTWLGRNPPEWDAAGIDAICWTTAGRLVAICDGEVATLEPPTGRWYKRRQPMQTLTAQAVVAGPVDSRLSSG